MKLTIVKKSTISITQNELSQVIGGDRERSNKFHTECRYSRKHKESVYKPVTGGTGCIEVEHCAAIITEE